MGYSLINSREARIQINKPISSAIRKVKLLTDWFIECQHSIYRLWVDYRVRYLPLG